MSSTWSKKLHFITSKMGIKEYADIQGNCSVKKRSNTTKQWNDGKYFHRKKHYKQRDILIRGWIKEYDRNYK